MSNSTFLPIGTLLSRQYKIIRHIGAGGFGKTYLVEDRMAKNKHYVVKEFFVSRMCMRDASNSVTVSVESDRQAFDSLLKRFEKEAIKVSELDHPNIVKVSRLFDANNTIYYVMDYVDGESLNDMLKRGVVFDEKKVMHYLTQLLDALEYIHSRKPVGVMHLDIKPANIMIDRNDNVVLIDFGASKSFNSTSVDETLLSSTGLLYTPGYAPIEQENGDKNDLGPHCDIYALGATLYRIFSGQNPPSPFAIFSKGLPAIPGISSKLQQVITKSMEFEVSNRIKNVAEFRAILGIEQVQIGKNEGTQIGKNEITQIAEVTQINKPSKIESFEEVVKGVTFKMIKVEGGTFKMGAQSSDPNGENYDSEADDDERPVHSVTLDDYYIGETVVTQELWRAVMGSPQQGFWSKLFGTKDDLSKEKFPKTSFSWNDCQEFIKKLNQLTGKRFRLPTEAEWEYAARGGKKSRGYKYAGSNTIGEVAWYRDNAYDVGYSSPAYGIHPVGTKSPNELGLYDMSGNVWEWCSDWYGKYSSSSQINPTGPTSSKYSSHVLRGGSWNCSAQNCRVSFRGMA